MSAQRNSRKPTQQGAQQHSQLVPQRPMNTRMQPAYANDPSEERVSIASVRQQAYETPERKSTNKRTPNAPRKQCKWGAECSRRADCIFSHDDSPPSTPQQHQPRPERAAPDAPQKQRRVHTVECRHGDQCVMHARGECTFLHLPEANLPMIQQASQFQGIRQRAVPPPEAIRRPTSAPSDVPVKRENTFTSPCKHGIECTVRGCKFLHPRAEIYPHVFAERLDASNERIEKLRRALAIEEDFNAAYVDANVDNARLLEDEEDRLAQQQLYDLEQQQAALKAKLDARRRRPRADATTTRSRSDSVASSAHSQIDLEDETAFQQGADDQQDDDSTGFSCTECTHVFPTEAETVNHMNTCHPQ
jgi:hypothetical protein